MILKALPKLEPQKTIASKKSIPFNHSKYLTLTPFTNSRLAIDEHAIIYTVCIFVEALFNSTF